MAKTKYDFPTAKISPGRLTITNQLTLLSKKLSSHRQDILHQRIIARFIVQNNIQNTQGRQEGKVKKGVHNQKWMGGALLD